MVFGYVGEVGYGREHTFSLYIYIYMYTQYNNPSLCLFYVSFKSLQPLCLLICGRGREKEVRASGLCVAL